MSVRIPISGYSFVFLIFSLSSMDACLNPNKSKKRQNNQIFNPNSQQLSSTNLYNKESICSNKTDRFSPTITDNRSKNNKSSIKSINNDENTIKTDSIRSDTVLYEPIIPPDNKIEEKSDNENNDQNNDGSKKKTYPKWTHDITHRFEEFSHKLTNIKNMLTSKKNNSHQPKPNQKVKRESHK